MGKKRERKKKKNKEDEGLVRKENKKEKVG